MKQRPTIEATFELKSINKKTGEFQGIASPFGELDHHRDIVMPGAFTKSLQNFRAKGRDVPMLWQHSSYTPIGIYPIAQIIETDKQLEVNGVCNMEVQQGRECHSLMDQGALTGLSIGYDTVRDEWDETGIVRKLFEVNLWEISPVTFPAADSARVTLVKTLDQADTLSDLEAILRDAGHSKAEARAFVSRVKAVAMRSDSAADANTEAVRAAIREATASFL